MTYKDDKTRTVIYHKIGTGEYEVALPTHGVMSYSKEEQVIAFLERNGYTNYKMQDGNPRKV